LSRVPPVREWVDLQPLNTLAVPARARWFAALERAEQVPALHRWASERGLPLLVLGGGSNLVLREDFPGLVVHNRIRGRQWQARHHGVADLNLGAGENWHEVVLYAADAGYRGIENLALIPGSVGAAPVQNIGAYGMELSDSLVLVEAYDLAEGAWVSLGVDDCGLGYRTSRFKREPDRYLITRIVLRLSRERPLILGYQDLAHFFRAQDPSYLEPLDVARAVMAIRRATLPDPGRLPNVGSFFQNPEVSQTTYQALKDRFPDIVAWPLQAGYKLAAAWLIDQCGWKGYRDEKVGVHSRQALVLVNGNGGTGEDILGLAQRIARDVKARFGIQLTPEPRIIPPL